MPKTLLVFVSVVYNNNFSIKYIHLERHFSEKKTIKLAIDSFNGEILYSLVLLAHWYLIM